MQHTSFLAFLIRPGGDTAPIRREWVEASDWFVLFTLGLLWFLLAAFAVWAWLIWRRSTKPEPHVRLLMELEEDEPADGASDGNGEPTTPRGEKPEPAAPWEQPADWWKKDR